MTPEHPEWYLITLADLQPRAAVRRSGKALKTNGDVAHTAVDHTMNKNLL